MHVSCLFFCSLKLRMEEYLLLFHSPSCSFINPYNDMHGEIADIYMAYLCLTIGTFLWIIYEDC